MVAGLSNFGNKDADVAMVKGVIALIAPGKPTCDLTHEISLQIILAGCLAQRSSSFLLLSKQSSADIRNHSIVSIHPVSHQVFMQTTGSLVAG